MADKQKIYTPDTIDDVPFPGREEPDYYESDGTQKVQHPTETPSRDFPVRRIATEVMSSALNTQSRRILDEFRFTQMGALQIGEYVNGSSGDIRISPNGIVARDSAGNTSFSLDGTNGNATFRGTIQAGAVVSGAVSVGNDSIVIDGDTQRMIFYDDSDVPVIVIGDI